MPPIMGAAAFLMAEMTGTEYADILVRAILPAALYFTGIFLMVHFKAKSIGLKGLDKDSLPKGKDIFPQALSAAAPDRPGVHGHPERYLHYGVQRRCCLPGGHRGWHG